MHRIGVIFIPDFTGENPYQRLLSEALSSESVEVSFGRNSLLLAVSVLSSLRKKDPEKIEKRIIHLHWPSSYLSSTSRLMMLFKFVLFPVNLATLVIFKRCGFKVVWTAHNVVGHAPSFKGVRLFLRKLLARLYDKVIAHTDAAAREIMNMYGIPKNKITVIPHGNFIGCYKSSITREEARKELSLREGSTVFLFFGAIRRYKGVEHLVETFMKMDRESVELVIAGKPSPKKLAEEILGKIGDNKNIKPALRFIPDDKIESFMNAADCAVLPYLNVLTSGAAVLAMSFSKAIIAPSSGCIPDLLDPEGSFQYDPEKQRGLLEVMETAALSGRDRLARMGEHNFALAKELSWEKVASKTQRVYLEVLS
ncbi:glycosyltransferase [Candidatus Omnitrophota bacterium]